MIPDITQDPRAQLLLNSKRQGFDSKQGSADEAQVLSNMQQQRLVDTSYNQADILGAQATWDVKQNDMVTGLAEVEGYEAVPYVPTYTSGPRAGEVIGHSGFSIANGIDLGQWSLKELQNSGLPTYLTDRIDRMNVLGVKGQDALMKLAETKANWGNMPFTDGEVALIGNTLTGVVEKQTRAWLAPGQYDSFTERQKKVVMSLTHLYGVGRFDGSRPDDETHLIAKAAIEAEDWSALYQEMRDYGDFNNRGRHKRMAEHLKPSINAGFTAKVYNP